MTVKNLEEPQALLTSVEAAALLPETSPQTLLRWAKQGRIPFVELPSGRKFFRRSDIEALLVPVGADVSVSEGGSGELVGQASLSWSGLSVE